MTAALAESESFSQRSVKRFLRTAVLIDDEIESAPEPAPPPEELHVPAFAEVVAETAKPAGEAQSSSRVSDVSLKPLADAFLDRQIICGVLKPEASDKAEDIIQRGVNSARVADVLIIDWYLRKGDPEITKSILLEVLRGDVGLNGRFRLVIVYTSEAPLADRRNELQVFLSENGLNAQPFDGAAPSLKLHSCRICFVGKSNGRAGTSVDELPDFAISQFTDEARGLLPAYALNGIAALREKTHHLLATFSAKLDPAFVGHRVLTGEDDFSEFALSLLMFQIKSLLSIPSVVGDTLSNAEISAWIDQKFADDKVGEKLKVIGITKEDVKSALLGDFSGNEKKLHSALFVSSIDDDIGEVESSVCSDFSRLSTFVRERDGFNPLPEGWNPSLTLGSLVRTRVQQKVRYYLCIQPLCDTVRLLTPTFFAFIELVNDKKNGDFWITTKMGNRPVHLRLDKKALSRHYAEFKSEPKTETVLARKGKKNAQGKEKFVFTSSNGSIYEWLGDVDRAKSQKAAVDVSTSLARIGLDEYEWLRRGAKVK